MDSVGEGHLSIGTCVAIGTVAFWQRVRCAAEGADWMW